MHIKWNEYTWYSKSLAALFFIVVFPAWTFYLGMQYQKTMNLQNSTQAEIQAQLELDAAVAMHSKTIPTRIPSGIEGKYEMKLGAITISKIDEYTLYIEGNAVWLGAHPELGQVNEGNIQGTTTLQDKKAFLKQFSCEVELIFTNGRLFAIDNNQCGGLNVSFTGEYRKQ
jgi:hypothetical protein